MSYCEPSKMDSKSSSAESSNSEYSGTQSQKSLPLDNLSNESRELKVNPSKGRVVPSKYKSAAVEVARKGKLTFGNVNPLLSRSNSGEAKSIDKSSVKPKKGPPCKRGGLYASTSSVSKPDYLLPNKHCSKILHQESQGQKTLNRDVSHPNPKLHSTAVYNSTFFDKTICGSSEVFSTTVVGKLPRSFPTLGELPDISTISPGNTNPSGSSFECISEELQSESLESARTNLVNEPSDYTKEEIAAEYMRYLTWAMVDIDSEDKYQQQITEAKPHRQ